VGSRRVIPVAAACRTVVGRPRGGARWGWPPLAWPSPLVLVGELDEVDRRMRGGRCKPTVDGARRDMIRMRVGRLDPVAGAPLAPPHAPVVLCGQQLVICSEVEDDPILGPTRLRREGRDGRQICPLSWFGEGKEKNPKIKKNKSLEAKEFGSSEL
jgi:hypothetical protein